MLAPAGPQCADAEAALCEDAADDPHAASVTTNAMIPSRTFTVPRISGYRPASK